MNEKLKELYDENKILLKENKSLKKALLKTQYGDVSIHDYYPITSKGVHVKHGLISDTHLGSLYDNPRLIETLYEMFKKEGIDIVYHCGDLVDGEKMYRGQEYELYAHGAEQQIDNAVKKYPNIDGIDTYFITGNHDLSFYKKAGIDIGKIIDGKRKDMNYLGPEQADLLVGNPSKHIKMKLMHPSKGTAYALCFDKETQILTENGWKYFYELNNERVATLNLKKMRFEWQKPMHYTREYYNGILYHFVSRNVDLMVTPNHRMLVRRYENRLKRKRILLFPTKSHRKINTNWIVKYAYELENTKRQTWQFMRGGCTWKSDNEYEYIEIPIREKFENCVTKIYIEDIAELIAWYVTEGHVDKKIKTVTITQSKSKNPENYYKIIDLIKRIGYKFSVYRDKDITIRSKQLAEFLNQECGRLSNNIHIPKWLKNQSKYTLNVLFDTLISGDGWINNKGYCYRYISKQLLDDVTEIAIKLGYAVTQYNDTLSITNIHIYPTINKKPNKVQYNDYIYSVTVPNTFILVKRNGKIVWTGNSYHAQKIAESFSGGKKPNVLYIGHFHKAEMLPCQRNIMIVQAGTTQKQTPYMARNFNAAHQGGWIIDFYIDRKYSIRRFKAEFFPYYERPKRKKLWIGENLN